jgi:hypothetical protein
MDQLQCTGYLRDLALLIKDMAREAKTTSDASTSDIDHRALSLERLMTLHEVVSLMQQQAEAFNIPLADIGLDDIDPEKDLI